MTRSRCADTIVAMSSYDESLQITCELVRRHLDGAREIRPSDHIQNDLGLDSLGVMEFVSDVESHFGISIPSEMFERISTVEDVARVVSKLQHGPVAVGP
jgi:acyl carrier protein